MSSQTSTGHDQDHDESKHTEENDEEGSCAPQRVIEVDDDRKPAAIPDTTAANDEGTITQQQQQNESDAAPPERFSPSTNRATIDDVDLDDDGPSLMEDYDTTTEQPSFSRAITKPGAVPLVTTTTERRDVPDHLQRRQTGAAAGGNSTSESTEKTRTTTPASGAMTPGAVAVAMARRPSDSTSNRTTTDIDPDRMWDIQSSASAFPHEMEEPAIPVPSSSTSPQRNEAALASNPNISAEAEQRLQRRPRPRHASSEESKLEEDVGSGVVEVATAVATAATSSPPPMDDIEANVTRVEDIEGIEGGYAHTIHAELVDSRSTAAGTNPEVERKKLQKQAEEAAKEKFLADAAEAQIVEDSEDTQKLLARRWKYVAIISILVVVLLIVAAVTTTTLQKRTPLQANATCAKAFGPLNLTETILTLEGSITKQDGEFSAICQVEYEGGYGQWYYLVGRGSRLQASTCNSEDASLDTEILVFSGDKCDNPTCIGGSDELCGSHGSVGWLAEQDEVYNILVRGNRASSLGEFNLTVWQVDPNGQCQNATVLPPMGSIIGSTRNLPTREVRFEDPCISSDTQQEGNLTASVGEAWYSIEGGGGVKCAVVTTETGAFDFPVSMSIYAGECDNNLQCARTTTSQEILWSSMNGSQYLMKVTGQNNNYNASRGKNQIDEGDFVLQVKDALHNSLCTTAEELPINTSISGTTFNSCRVSQQSCKSESKGIVEDSSSVHGVWYGVSGTGNFFELSFCNVLQETESPLVFDLSLYDISKGCENRQCMQPLIEGCGSTDLGKKLSWLTSKGSLYSILIQSSNPVTFGINLTEFSQSSAERT